MNARHSRVLEGVETSPELLGIRLTPFSPRIGWLEVSLERGMSRGERAHQQLRLGQSTLRMRRLWPHVMVSTYKVRIEPREKPSSQQIGVWMRKAGG